MKKELVFTHEPTSDEILEEIREKIPSFIGGKRLNHTFFVEKEAIAIAQAIFLVYNISDRYLNDVKAAALLHDMTKQTDLKTQLELCRIHGIDAGDGCSDAVLHGKTAAHMARELFNINDTVFSAIYNHTTGCENMGLLDKIIFIADYTEQSRIHEHCITTRSFLHKGLEDNCDNIIEILDKAIVLSIDGTISHLIATEKCIDIQTILTRNGILKQLQSNHQD